MKQMNKNKSIKKIKFIKKINGVYYLDDDDFKPYNIWLLKYKNSRAYCWHVFLENNDGRGNPVIKEGESENLYLAKKESLDFLIKHMKEENILE